MTSSNRGFDSPEVTVTIGDIRQLRETTDFLTNNATQLIWPEGTESVDDGGVKLGDYLFLQTPAEQRLPQAVLIDSKKYYYL